MSDSRTNVIARETGVSPRQVDAVLRLVADGGTIPFIARYRKEATGGLDEVKLRAIGERERYLAELDARREAIRESIAEQGKLTGDLASRLDACATKTDLEDLYLPYRPKRRTRATMARERGLEPLAARILAQPREGNPALEAQAFVDPARGVPDVEAAFAGARDIVAETMAERADLRKSVREVLLRHGLLAARVIKKAVADGAPTKFQDYYDYSEPVSRIPSHRYLAVKRGEREGILRVRVEVDEERVLGLLLRGMLHRPGSPFAGQLHDAVTDGQKRLLGPAVEKDVQAALKERSDAAAVEIFAENLRSLLLAAPLGEQPVLGLDPGFRTGVKCAVVSATGPPSSTKLAV